MKEVEHFVTLSDLVEAGRNILFKKRDEQIRAAFILLRQKGESVKGCYYKISHKVGISWARVKQIIEKS
ncbi:MAG: hypothetical protein WC390_09075 [Sulfurimonas sp.]|jgi:hypothetical protein